MQLMKAMAALKPHPQSTKTTAIQDHPPPNERRHTDGELMLAYVGGVVMAMCVALPFILHANH